MSTVPRAVSRLSWIATTAASVASLATLLWDGAFPDLREAASRQTAHAEARGWSAVTLGLVVPILIMAMEKARRGSLRARLTWSGLLFYLIYTYLEFAVSPPFSALFLLYVTTFACALPALIALLWSMGDVEIDRTMMLHVPRRSVAAFAFVSASVLCLAWLKDIGTRTWLGEFGFRSGDLAIAQVVQALDLGLQVPLCTAAGVLMLRRRRAGWIAGGVMLVNATCMGFALLAMVVAAKRSLGESLLGALPFTVMPIVATCLSVAFFRTLRAAEYSTAGRNALAH